MSLTTILSNLYLWMGLAFFFLLGFLVLLILLVLISKRTHAMMEFKASFKKKPIAMFFREDRYVEWKSVVPEAGIVTDENYGAFIISNAATYIDKHTKNVIIPFDASFGASVNVHAAKLVDDLQYVVSDEEQMNKLRYAISNNLIEESDTISALKTSIQMGALKSMMTALIPHNINSKIEMIVAGRMHGSGKANIMQFLLLFGGVLGAILVGYMIIKLAVPH